jgi:hypothetical protein
MNINSQKTKQLNYKKTNKKQKTLLQRELKQTAYTEKLSGTETYLLNEYESKNNLKFSLF